MAWHQSSAAMMTQVFFFLLVFLLSVYLLLTKKASKRLPPGSLGLPIIGQSLSFLSAMRKNTAEEWLQDRIRKYGPVSKMSILGAPTLFIHGQAANKSFSVATATLWTVSSHRR